MKKIKKGEYGYRTYHKKAQFLKIALLAAFILAQLIGRSFVDSQAAKNIITVMAILTVLPTANLASPYVASFPYRTPPKSFYDTLRPYGEQFTILFDLIITTREAILPMDAVIVHPTGVYAYCTNKRADITKAEKSINEMFKGHRLDPNVKIIAEEGAFMKRLKSLKPADEYEDDGSVGYAANLLKNLSI